MLRDQPLPQVKKASVGSLGFLTPVHKNQLKDSTEAMYRLTVYLSEDKFR
jgi:NAD kinase